jgi:hypothetical protein
MRSWHRVRNPKQKQPALSGKTGWTQCSRVGNSTKLVACCEDSWLGVEVEVEVEVDCLALFLVGMFVSLQLGM